MLHGSVCIVAVFELDVVWLIGGLLVFDCVAD